MCLLAFLSDTASFKLKFGQMAEVQTFYESLGIVIYNTHDVRRHEQNLACITSTNNFQIERIGTFCHVIKRIGLLAEKKKKKDLYAPV